MTPGAGSERASEDGARSARLAVRRDSDGHDVLYLPDTAHNSLCYGLR